MVLSFLMSKHLPINLRLNDLLDGHSILVHIFPLRTINIAHLAFNIAVGKKAGKTKSPTPCK